MPIFQIVRLSRFSLFIAASLCENHLLVIIISQCTVRHYFFSLINSILRRHWFPFKPSHLLRLVFRRSNSQWVQLTLLALTVNLKVLAPNRSFREPLSKWTG